MEIKEEPVILADLKALINEIAKIIPPRVVQGLEFLAKYRFQILVLFSAAIVITLPIYLTISQSLTADFVIPAIIFLIVFTPAIFVIGLFLLSLILVYLTFMALYIFRSSDKSEKFSVRISRIFSLISYLERPFQKFPIEDFAVIVKFFWMEYQRNKLLKSTISILVGIVAFFFRRSFVILATMVDSMVVITIGTNAVLLVLNLLSKKMDATQLLIFGAIIWIANVAAFALVYWSLDMVDDGYHGNHIEQNRASEQMKKNPAWHPNITDYLYLAFNISTSFSVTDSPPISRLAKWCLMLQAVISLIITLVLIARAINAIT